MQLKQRYTLAAFACLVTAGASAQSLSLAERIKIGTDAVKLGCGMESKQENVNVDVGADGSITLRKLPSASAKGQVKYSSKEAVGLISAFQKEITAEGARLSEKQLDCMKKYVDRIIDAVLPASGSDKL